MTNKHHSILPISVNKISSSSKKTFKTRVFSALIMLLFFTLIITLVALSDNIHNWSPLSLVGKRICAWLFLVLVVPIIFLAVVEIHNIYFRYNKLAFAIISILIFSTIYIPTLQYFLYFYGYWTSIDLRDVTFNFLISGTMCALISAIVIIFYMWTQNLASIKKSCVFLVLYCFSSAFFIAFFYFSFIKGWTTVLILFFITGATDTFAYLGGMLFGRKKLSPFISPKKTIEGAISGVLCCTLFTMLIILLFSFADSSHNILGNFFGIKFKYYVDILNIDNQYANYPLWWLFIFIILSSLSLISIAGDLSYSHIKRMYKIKDFSNLIPGHGGFLDRFDSATFVFSIYFVFTIVISLYSSTAPLWRPN